MKRITSQPVSSLHADATEDGRGSRAGTVTMTAAGASGKQARRGIGRDQVRCRAANQDGRAACAATEMTIESAPRRAA
jgi:hypothetical protein